MGLDRKITKEDIKEAELYFQYQSERAIERLSKSQGKKEEILEKYRQKV